MALPEFAGHGRLDGWYFIAPDGALGLALVPANSPWPGGKIPEFPPIPGLIVPGADGFETAAGKIIIRHGAAAGRTGVSPVDYGIAVAGMAVRIGAGLKEHGRQHEEHQSFYHVTFLPGWVPGLSLFYLKHPKAFARQIIFLVRSSPAGCQVQGINPPGPY